MLKKFSPNLSQYKILVTIYELNSKNIFPLPEGVFHILNGDEKEFDTISTFSTLCTYTSKKISRLLLLLYRYGYVKKFYDENTDKLYLELSEFGYVQTKKFISKHPTPFKKHNKKKPCYFLIKEK